MSDTLNIKTVKKSLEVEISQKLEITPETTIPYALRLTRKLNSVMEHKQHEIKTLKSELSKLDSDMEQVLNLILDRLDISAENTFMKQLYEIVKEPLMQKIAEKERYYEIVRQIEDNLLQEAYKVSLGE